MVGTTQDIDQDQVHDCMAWVWEQIEGARKAGKIRTRKDLKRCVYWKVNTWIRDREREEKRQEEAGIIDAENLTEEEARVRNGVCQ